MPEAKVKLINLWAPPGVGKSRTMAALFSLMKKEDLRVEMSPEFAKGLSYSQNHLALADPFYVTAMQEHQSFILRGKVDYIVTDSPTGISALYCRRDNGDRREVLALAEHLRTRYINFDVRLTRDDRRHFQNYGRHHTEEQSRAMESDLGRIVNRLATGPVFEVLADAAAPVHISRWLLKEEFNYGYR